MDAGGFEGDPAGTKGGVEVADADFGMALKVRDEGGEIDRAEETMKPRGGEVGEGGGHEGGIAIEGNGGRPLAESVGLMLAFPFEAPVLVGASAPMVKVVVIEVWMAYGSEPLEDLFVGGAFLKHIVELVADRFGKPSDFGTRFGIDAGVCICIHIFWFSGYQGG